MKEIQSIELLLENMEAIRLSPDEVKNFYCNGITGVITKVTHDCVLSRNTCREMCLELCGSANKKYDSFGEESKLRAFERLTTPDIVIVEVKYTDGNEDEVYVPWNEDKEDINGYQTSYITPRGDLRIYIGEEKDVREVFGEKDSPKSSGSAKDVSSNAPQGQHQHGQWIKKHDDMCYWCACSECIEVKLQNIYGGDYFSNYCPGCGVEMDAEVD